MNAKQVVKITLLKIHLMNLHGAELAIHSDHLLFDRFCATFHSNMSWGMMTFLMKGFFDEISFTTRRWVSTGLCCKLHTMFSEATDY